MIARPDPAFLALHSLHSLPTVAHRVGRFLERQRKVFTLQTLPACDELFDDEIGKVAG